VAAWAVKTISTRLRRGVPASERNAPCRPEREANGGSAVYGGTTRRHGYAVRQRKRKRIEECFGWIKTNCADAQNSAPRHRDVGWLFTFAATCNLVRMRNIMVRSGGGLSTKCLSNIFGYF